jgi:hypothetical protein
MAAVVSIVICGAYVGAFPWILRRILRAFDRHREEGVKHD